MSQVSDNILKRVYLLFGGIALLAIVTLARVVQIQFIQKDRWIEAVSKERIYEQHIPASRGNILADGGEVLATSQPFYMLPIDPSRVDTTQAAFPAQFDSLCKLLAQHFGDVVHDEHHYHDYLMEHMRYRDEHGRPDRHLYVVRHKVDFEDYRMVREWPILRNSKFEGGLMMEKLNNTRFYPYDSLARITLGVIAHDTLPLKGLEFAFHKYLKGEEGLAMVQRITGGYELPIEVFQEDEDGADVETTINVAMQDIVETELRRGVLKHNAKYGVAVLMEVGTGEIKAVANYPETQNHALATRIDPGSTFKLASFMALMESDKVNLDDSIDTNHGKWKFFDRVMTDHADYGKITYRDAFEHSVNTVTARLVDDAYSKGTEAWFKRLEDFGLTEPVMLQEHVVGEPKPHFIRPSDQEDWTKITLPWMAIGYNSQLTPLQILTFYNAVANDGKMMEPILVKRIRKGSKVVVEYNSQVIKERIASKHTIDEARNLLRGVVLRGTAKGVETGKCTMAGKTGTARKLSKITGEYQAVYQASFAGYFPADKPRYSLYVMVDEPNGEYYGASVAAPIFAEIAQQVYTGDMDLVQEYIPREFHQHAPITRTVNQANAKAVYHSLDLKGAAEAEGTWVRTTENEGKIEFSKLDIKQGRVPNVYGMSAKDAVVLLESLGMKVMLNGHGKVRSQSIHAGEPTRGNMSIALELR